MRVLIFTAILSFINAHTIIVIDGQTGDPIQNVNVFTMGDGTTTDKQGYCNLDIFNKNDEITFSMIGYSTMTLPFIEISKVVRLQKESIPLGLVNVIGKNKKSKRW